MAYITKKEADKIANELSKSSSKEIKAILKRIKPTKNKRIYVTGRPEWPLQRLKSMYFAMHCWKCKKFELPMEQYKKQCEDNIQKIIDCLEIKEMRFRDFNEIIKESNFCKFEKRDFENNCPICKKNSRSASLRRTININEGDY